LKGNIEIKLLTSKYPNGELCGNFKSVGCPITLPPAVPIVLPCAVVTTMFEVYTDKIPGWPSWDGESWNGGGLISTFNGLSTENVACGTKSLKLDLKKGGFGFYWTKDASGNYAVIDVSVYDYFEMFVKTEVGYIALSLTITFLRGDNT
jgi:hypothetical protein